MPGIDQYTKLMLHGNGDDGSQTIVDSEITPKDVTAVGNAQIDTAQKYFGTGSILFDGTGDYLTLVDSDDWNYAQAPFTIDGWFRWNSVGSQYLYAQYLAGDEIDLYYHKNTLNFYNSTLSFSAPFTPNTNQWYHIALVRVNTDNAATGWRIFVDGTSLELTKTSGAWNATLTDVAGTLQIGAYNGGTVFNGWIDEFRISKGIARWTADFTPPTTEYDNILTTIKKIAGVAYASIKKVSGVAIASVKKIIGVS